MLIRPAKTWDLTALLNAADPRAPLAARNLWLARLLEWLRHPASRDEKSSLTPLPLLRLKHLLNVLDRHPEHAASIAELLNSIWARCGGCQPVLGCRLCAARGAVERVLPTGCANICYPARPTPMI